MDTGIVAGRAEEIGFRLIDDPFANGVFVNMSDSIHEEAGPVVLDPERAAAVLPKMIFLQAPEGLAVFFEALQHPFAAEVHFDFDRFEEGGRRKLFKVSFEISGSRAVSCTEYKVEVAAHEAPGIKVQALSMDEVIQRVGNHLFVGGSDKQIDLIHYVECQKITGVERENGFFIQGHTHLFR
jgi:hypothetical protein